MAFNAKEFLEKHGNDPERALNRLADDNFDLREKNREVKREKDDLEAKLEKSEKEVTKLKEAQGNTVSKEDFEAFQAFKKLNKSPEEIAKLISDGDTEKENLKNEIKRMGLTVDLTNAGVPNDRIDAAIKLFDDSFYHEVEEEQNGQKVKVRKPNVDQFKEKHGYFFGVDGVRGVGGKGEGKGEFKLTNTVDKTLDARYSGRNSPFPQGE